MKLAGLEIDLYYSLLNFYFVEHSVGIVAMLFCTMLSSLIVVRALWHWTGGLGPCSGFWLLCLGSLAFSALSLPRILHESLLPVPINHLCGETGSEKTNKFVSFWGLFDHGNPCFAIIVHAIA